MKYHLLQCFFLALLCACTPQNTGPERTTSTENNNNKSPSICAPLPPQTPEPSLIESWQGKHSGWHFWRNGILIDLGSPEAVKYQQGLWNTTWQAGEFVSEEQAQKDKLAWLSQRWLAWNLGSSALLRFPLPPHDAKENEKWLLTLRLRPKVNTNVDVRLNSHGVVASLKFSGGWETLQTLIDADKLKFGGENTINFSFSGSYFEGEQRVAAKFDYFTLTPHDGVTPITANNDAALNPPVCDMQEAPARILDQSLSAYGLVYGDEMQLYRVLQPNTELRFFLGPGAWLQKPAKFLLELVTDEGMLYPVYEKELQPGGCWEAVSLDLSQWANVAVRLRLRVQSDIDSPLAWPCHRPIAYVAQLAVHTRQSNKTLQAYAEAVRQQAKNVVILNIDALRADRVLSPAQSRATAPLQALAAKGLRGVVLGEGSGSLLSTVSLLYGVSTNKHGVRDTKTHVRSSLQSLGELFEAGGWQTQFYTNNSFIAPKLGYAQGFRTVRDLQAEGLGTNTKSALDLVLRAMGEAKAPTLYYVHLAQMRLPYSASDEQLQRFGEKNYAGPINSQGMQNLAILNNYTTSDAKQLAAYYDASLERLVQAVMEFINNAAPNTLIVLTASHGISLGEDSLLGYNNSLSPAELLLPYIFTMKEVDGSYFIPELMRVYDIYATLAQIMGFSNTEQEGHSVIDASSLSGRGFAQSETHRATALGPYFYLLRDGDNDTLSRWSWEEMKSKNDLRDTHPIAHRAMRDRLFLP